MAPLSAHPRQRLRLRVTLGSADNTVVRFPPQEKPYDSVEIAAGNLMGAAVIFLLLQVPVMIIFLVFVILLPGLGVLSTEDGAKLGMALALIAEVVLVT